MSVTSSTCDVERGFKDLRFILNINFCGDAAGPQFGNDARCAAKAKSCDAYVSNNPQDFEDVYWKIKYIDVYQLQQALPSTTSSAISSTTTSSAIGSTVTSSFVSVVSSSTASSSDVVSSSSAVVSASASAVRGPEVVVSGTKIFSNIASTSVVASGSDVVSITATSAAALPTGTNGIPDCDDEDEGEGEGDDYSGIFVPGGSATETGKSPMITSVPSGGPSAGFHHGNSSSGVGGLFPNSTITAPQQWTTSTVYATSYYTITSCAATVTNCPARVVTSVIAISTTVCPVTQHPAPTNAPSGGNGVPVVSGGGSNNGNGGVPPEATGTGSGSGSGSASASVPPVATGPLPTVTLPGNNNGALDSTFSAPLMSNTGIPSDSSSSSPYSLSIAQPPLATATGDAPVMTAGAGKNKNALSVGLAMVAGVVTALFAL